jgi:uncharacterized membrane-anchored protein YitT (DUF2179 family)
MSIYTAKNFACFTYFTQENPNEIKNMLIYAQISSEETETLSPKGL